MKSCEMSSRVYEKTPYKLHRVHRPNYYFCSQRAKAAQLLCSAHHCLVGVLGNCAGAFLHTRSCAVGCPPHQVEDSKFVRTIGIPVLLRFKKVRTRSYELIDRVRAAFLVSAKDGRKGGRKHSLFSCLSCRN